MMSVTFRFVRTTSRYPRKWRQQDYDGGRLFSALTNQPLPTTPEPATVPHEDTHQSPLNCQGSDGNNSTNKGKSDVYSGIDDCHPGITRLVAREITNVPTPLGVAKDRGPGLEFR